MVDNGCGHYGTFYRWGANLNLFVFYNQQHFSEFDLVTYFDIQQIDIDRSSFDGAVLLAATFHYCVLHF